jgi:2-keto-4-pentenoate hydratase
LICKNPTSAAISGAIFAELSYEFIFSFEGWPMITHEKTAEELRDAYSSGPIPPLRYALQPSDGVGAYAVQSINTRYWQSRGRRLVGRKIGLTSKAVQVQLGVDQPDFGALFDDMAIPNRGTLKASQVLQPRAEAEIALVLGQGIDNPEATAEQVAAATSYAVAAIEIVDSRIADWKITFADTVADNGSSAFFVLGDERKALAGLDLYTCGMALEVNGMVASSGAGAACLGHPLNAAAWLARTLNAAGESLRAGDVILTGALGPMVRLNRGDHVVARIGGVGSVAFSYQE